jgi:hypothetical protein
MSAGSSTAGIPGSIEALAAGAGEDAGDVVIAVVVFVSEEVEHPTRTTKVQAKTGYFMSNFNSTGQRASLSAK